MTSPLIQPSSAGMSTFKASRWNVQVFTGDGDPTDVANEDDFVWWNGISKFEPTQDPTMQDDTDINSRGYKSQLTTATSEDVNVEGLIKGRKSLSTLPVDPGAKFVRSKRREVGEDNVVTLRYWRDDELDDDAVLHDFAVSWKDVGGSNEDLQKFTADLKGRGEPRIVDRPESP